MPHFAFEAMTVLSKKEFVETLKSNLTQVDWLGRPKDPKPFFGTVSKSDFKITRVVVGRDSFNPVVIGHFWSANQHTYISVRMTLHPLVMTGLTIYFFLIGGGFLATVLNNGSDKGFLFLFLLFPCLIGIPLFYYNASKSKKLLQEKLRLIDITKSTITKQQQQ